MSELPVIDMEAIENLRALSPGDGDVFLKEIIDIFVEDTPQRIAELRASRQSGDTEAFVRSAHSIKGSSSNVGAARLRDVAATLEAQGRSSGMDGAEPLVARLEAAFEEAREALGKLPKA